MYCPSSSWGFAADPVHDPWSAWSRPIVAATGDEFEDDFDDFDEDDFDDDFDDDFAEEDDFEDDLPGEVDEEDLTAL